MILFVDCIPIGTTVVDFAKEILPKAHEKVGQHYKLVKFGEGMGKYAEAIDSVLASYKGQNVFVSSRMPEAADALATMIANADMVIRGVP